MKKGRASFFSKNCRFSEMCLQWSCSSIYIFFQEAGSDSEKERDETTDSCDSGKKSKDKRRRKSSASASTQEGTPTLRAIRDVSPAG